MNPTQPTAISGVSYQPLRLRIRLTSPRALAIHMPLRVIDAPSRLRGGLIDQHRRDALSNTLSVCRPALRRVSMNATRCRSHFGDGDVRPRCGTGATLPRLWLIEVRDAGLLIARRQRRTIHNEGSFILRCGERREN
jgi:hypothetical protein